MRKRISPVLALVIIIFCTGIVILMLFRLTEAPLGGAPTGPPRGPMPSSESATPSRSPNIKETEKTSKKTQTH